jgi:membrane-associated protease RseP (regulator of RpoE activity)
LIRRIGRTIETAAFGIAGEATILVGRIEKAAVGDLQIQQPVIAVSEITKGSLGSSDFAGILGADFLSRLRVILDYPNSRMRLIPTEHLFHRPNYDMSGLVVFEKPPDFQVFQVMFVIDASPAAEAGIRAGDVIEEIDGCSATDWTLAEFRHLCRTRESRISLAIRRGRKRWRCQILTRPLI